MYAFRSLVTFGLCVHSSHGLIMTTLSNNSHFVIRHIGDAMSVFDKSKIG